MTPNSEPSRASEIWKRFAGMFGADALERKFGKSPPPEWVAMLSRFNDFEIDRGVRRLAYSGKAGVPSLPEFTKLCRMVADDAVDEGPRLPALPKTDTQEFDDMAIAANIRFLKYVTTRLAARPRAWGAPGSAQQAEATRIAVRYKNAWAQDLREWGTPNPTLEEQNTAWEGCMARAEFDISVLLQARAA